MLSFLSKVTVSAVEPAKKTPAARPKKQYQPINADIRIWASGAVFPSAALVVEFNLGYQSKEAEHKGFGFDIIDIEQMPAIKSPERFVAISATLKNAGKVDIFSSVGYNEADGSPKVTVEEQGAATFGKEVLLPLLKEVYNVEPNEEGFIDLNIFRDMPFVSPNGIFNFPKTVSRGDKKGETTYTRRENQSVYALVPFASETDTAENAAELSADDLPGMDTLMEVEKEVVAQADLFANVPATSTPKKATAKA